MIRYNSREILILYFVSINSEKKHFSVNFLMQEE